MFPEIPVSDVMVSDVVSIRPDATVGEAADRMADNDVGSVVVTEADKPIGILTSTDVVELVSVDGDAAGTAVRDRMSSPVVTIAPEEPIDAAARRLLDRSVKRLPVVESGSLVGIVTVTDLSYYLPSIATGRRETRKVPATRPEIAYDEVDWTGELSATEADEVGVGDTISFTKWLSEEDVVDFARASGDTNRLHLDEGFAVGTRFGERIVHGALVAGVISAALARLPGLTILISQTYRFRGPVPVDATVTAVCEVTEALGGSRYRLSVTVYHDEESVIDGEATVLIDELHEAPAMGRDAVEG